MELIIFVAVLCIVGVLAMRFGYDSRVTAYSKEEDLASLGLSRDHAGTTLCDTRREASLHGFDHASKSSPLRWPMQRTLVRVLRALGG